MKIRLVMLEDWTALYIDDKMVMQNHELYICDVIEKILPPEGDFKVVSEESLEFDLPQKWTDKLEALAQ